MGGLNYVMTELWEPLPAGSRRRRGLAKSRGKDTNNRLGESLNSISALCLPTAENDAGPWGLFLNEDGFDEQESVCLTNRVVRESMLKSVVTGQCSPDCAGDVGDRGTKSGCRATQHSNHFDRVGGAVSLDAFVASSELAVWSNHANRWFGEDWKA